MSCNPCGCGCAWRIINTSKPRVQPPDPPAVPPPPPVVPPDPPAPPPPVLPPSPPDPPPTPDPDPPTYGSAYCDPTYERYNELLCRLCDPNSPEYDHGQCFEMEMVMFAGWRP